MENLRQGKIRLTQRFPCSQETDTGDAWQPAILSGFWFFSVEPIFVKLSACSHQFGRPMGDLWPLSRVLFQS